MKRRFSKVLSVILCLFLLTATASVAFAADPVLAGSGTETDPFVVTDVAGMNELAANPGAYAGKYVVLGNDITATRAIRIIGTSEEKAFSGIFDGCGYTITGKKINETGSYSGLFGYAKNATIKNVTLKGVQFSNASDEYDAIDCVGGIVGNADHTVVSGVKTVGCTMQAGSIAGGIVGKAVNGSVVEDSVSDCKVVLNTGANGGGIVGEVNGSEISRCINTAEVVGGSQKNVAGIAGSVVDATVSHCLNKGSVSANGVLKNAGVAGIAGSVSGNSTVSFCGNAGSITSGTDCSGLVGVASGSAAIRFCYNAGNLAFGGNYADSSYTFAPAAATVENCVGVSDTVTAASMLSTAAYEGWDFDKVWYAPGDYHGYAYPVLRDCNFHTLDKSETPATCTSDGAIVYTCTDETCGFSSFEEGEKAPGHDYSILVSTKEANCTYEGEKTYKCSRCQQENPDKEILPVDPDKHVDENQDNICDICEKTIKEEEVKKSFFQRVIDFFKRIFDWIKRLFTGQL